MRKTILALAAAAAMGIGLNTASAASSPIEGVIQGVQFIQSESGTLLSEPGRGIILLGLNRAEELGVSTGGLRDSLAAGITASNLLSFGGRYTGDEAYGVARANVTGAAAVLEFYDVVVPLTGTPNTYANTDFGSGAIYFNEDSVPDSFSIDQIAHHVLASNLVGSTNAVAWRTELVTALGTFDANADYTSTGPFPSAVGALATAIYALNTVGYTGTVGGELGGLSFGTQAEDIKDLLLDLITGNNTFQSEADGGGTAPSAAGQNFDANEGFTETLAAGILALKSFAVLSVDDLAQISTLEYMLASLISPTYTPYNILDPDTGSSVQYAGFAIQALPEPATVGLVGLMGLGLLSRRRRA